MARSGARKVLRYGDQFKATAVVLKHRGQSVTLGFGCAAKNNQHSPGSVAPELCVFLPRAGLPTKIMRH